MIAHPVRGRKCVRGPDSFVIVHLTFIIFLFSDSSGFEQQAPPWSAVACYRFVTALLNLDSP